MTNKKDIQAQAQTPAQTPAQAEPEKDNQDPFQSDELTALIESGKVEMEKNDRGKVIKVTVHLDFPVEIDSAEYKKLSFRRLRASDTHGGEKHQDQGGASVALYATLANVPEDVILELDAEDLEDIAESTAVLMGKNGGRVLAAMKAVRAQKEEIINQYLGEIS